MEGVYTLKQILNPGDWLAKVDLKDAFFVIPIHVAHRKYLRFMFQRKVYEFNCLPFGLSSAPCFFYQDPKTSYSTFTGAGSAVVTYINDMRPIRPQRGFTKLISCD